MPGRVLVTGANGFAGRALCNHLQARGWTVRGSLRRQATNLPAGVEAAFTGDIDARTDWSPWLDGVGAVVHCAARVHVLKETAGEPLSAFRSVNVDASGRLAEQAAEAGVRRFVFLSSIGARVAAADAGKATPYQRSKLEAETLLQEINRRHGMVLVILRPPLIYGRDAPGNFRRLAALIAAGWPLPLSGLANRRSLLFVGNLAGAVEAALRCEVSPATPLELSDGDDLSTAALARRIGESCGRPARLFPLPTALLHLAGRLLGRSATVAALTEDLTIDNAAIRDTLGWSPEFTLDEGFAASFRDRNGGAPR